MVEILKKETLKQNILDLELLHKHTTTYSDNWLYIVSDFNEICTLRIIEIRKGPHDPMSCFIDRNKYEAQ